MENIQNQHIYNDSHTLKLDRNDINPEKIDYQIKDILQQYKQETNFELTEGLRIPIGKVAGQTHYFTIGHETDNYHEIIGGQPGKGKMVCSTISLQKELKLRQKTNFLLSL